jgi:hypothetical protein
MLVPPDKLEGIMSHGTSVPWNEPLKYELPTF